ncbi:MAG: glucose 1-dehydrogenase [Peptococcaceae bacterium]|nr:glucose 1-dehydrogenase [Peptococcaceae bacterium]
MKRVEGKVAIVTGATSGIGAAQAAILASEGAKVVCTGRNRERMELVLNRIHKAGGEAIGRIMDVSKADECNSTALLAIKEFGKIDILCNTAGFFDGFKNTIQQTEEGWDELYNVDVKGTFLMTKAVLPYMLENGGGSVINMASIAGLTGTAGGVAYVSAKHAVCGYTKQLCIDFAAQGIRANAIAAGIVTTPLLEEIFENNPEEREIVFQTLPCKRLGTPEDMAYLTLFLASDEASWIHGAIISADGGRHAMG